MQIICRWWKDLVSQEIIHFWILGVYFELKYALARKTTTKVVAMCFILDDMYDAYGTLDELELFTHAIDM